jgi:hypothetical protein
LPIIKDIEAIIKGNFLYAFISVSSVTPAFGRLFSQSHR